ncbi:hypothetical protein EUGRSUZ_F00145 [Eucalyptus grandis]|uniref:Uncharacterized protein n=2 Tax=Eucalyptus grandis TaxID=71139 RepID=A0ACC3KA30_EUCGR|nr:hypothetical protein EUGRSUZ_F00145 [Eucalyptus grandis]
MEVLHKILILLLLSSLLVSGDGREEAVNANGMSTVSPGAKERWEKQHKGRHPRLRFGHSPPDKWLSSKRRVPNASDPLHNR